MMDVNYFNVIAVQLSRFEVTDLASETPGRSAHRILLPLDQSTVAARTGEELMAPGYGETIYRLLSVVWRRFRVARSPRPGAADRSVHIEVVDAGWPEE